MTGVLAALFAGGLAAPAAQATAGVPDAPVALFTENFENVPGAAAQLIQDYTGAPPFLGDYSADNGWIGSLGNCNGLVISFNSSPTECPILGAEASIKAAARKLGTFAGAASPADNHAIGEHGNVAPGGGDVELQFAEGIQLTGASGRFLAAGVDVAVLDCAIGAPRFSFEMNPTRGDPPVEGPIVELSPAPQDACVQGGDLGDGFRGGRLYSDAAVLADFDAFNLFLRNANTDIEASSFHGLDNLVVADVTPVLDQSFASSAATTGSTVTLTLTITTSPAWTRGRRCS